MNGRRLLIVLGTVLSLVLVASALAQDPLNRAALVVSLGDSRTETRCVEFAEPEISGLDLLERSGLQLDVEFQSGGALVCNIQGTGCPANDCLCQCRGGPDCLYWSYWQLMDGEWAYSLAGATTYMVQDGTVQGWSWGPGSVTDAIPPPATSFDAICQVAAPATNTPVPTSPPVILPTLPPVGGGEVATLTVRPSPSATAGAASSTVTLPAPTPTRAEATVAPATVAATVPLLAETQPPAAGVSTTILPATETPVAVPVSGNSQESADEGGDEIVDSSESILEESSLPTPTDPSDPATIAQETESVMPTAIASIENNPVITATAGVREVVGQTTSVLPPTAPDLVAEPDEGAAQDVPLARYAIFGAFVMLLVALFGFAYLRRAGNKTDKRGQQS